jgi:hypothetical protein
MTAEREAHLLAQVATITCRAEMDAFRAQITAQGESVTADLYRAMQRKADTFPRPK